MEGEGRNDEEGFHQGRLVVGACEEKVGVRSGDGTCEEGYDGGVGYVHREEGGEGVGGVALGAENCRGLVYWAVCWIWRAGKGCGWRTYATMLRCVRLGRGRRSEKGKQRRLVGGSKSLCHAGLESAVFLRRGRDLLRAWL